MSTRILFISDLHLEESRPDITDAFLGFLDSNKSACSALYILGDLFEVWIGDDNRTPLGESVAEALNAFHQAGPTVQILHGNRDFLLGAEYAQRCGATLLKDYSTIDSPIGPILVLHGDDLCTDDVEYIQFRDRVRQAAWQQDFLGKTLDERRDFAQQARQQSQKANSGKNISIMDVNPQAVAKCLLERNQSLLIHGHTHRPAIHDFTLADPARGQRDARRVVLGDWDKDGWYIDVSPAGLRLEKFPL